MSQMDEVLRNSDEILDRLLALDYYCLKKQIKAELVILGGAGILLLLEQLGKTFRSTRDIDVNILKASDRQTLLNLLSKVGIDVVDGVMEVPPPEDLTEAASRFELDVEFEALRVFVPSLELLACSKFFSKREKDLIDLRESSLLDECNQENLLKMVEEYKEYFTFPEHPDLNLHKLVEILKERSYTKDTVNL